ncbi:MAG: hypothetical protein JNK05_41330 [Myxococcales bacterium]|nr:hypothetical protein [Myxococcales bacterium]
MLSWFADAAKRSQATRRAALFATIVAAACDNGGTRRAPARDRSASEPEVAQDGAASPTQSALAESNPAIEVGEAEDFMGTQCPGVRLYRAPRRWRADAGEGPLAPRYFGRDDRGRIVSLSSVVLCELEQMHWVTTPHMEGSLILLWRGPWLFSGDDECVWRQPFRTAETAAGRAIVAHERCTRRARAGLPRERTVTIEVDREYRSLRGP